MLFKRLSCTAPLTLCCGPFLHIHRSVHRADRLHLADAGRAEAEG